MILRLMAGILGLGAVEASKNAEIRKRVAQQNTDEVIKRWNKPFFDPEVYDKCNARIGDKEYVDRVIKEREEKHKNNNQK